MMKTQRRPVTKDDFEVYLFFPLVVFGYLFLEVLPYFLGKSASIAKFDIGRTIYEVFAEDLDELDDEDLK